MKAVFINHCHPKIEHVCGIRAGRFAETMVANGHKVVLITQSLDGEADSFPPDELADRLATHDWHQPFQISCQPRGNFATVRARKGEIVPALRQLVILWSFLRYGGMFPDWQTSVSPYLTPLTKEFHPDVVWGTFGNTDTWRLCQQLAISSKCPWVGDFKDNWLTFIPTGLKTIVANYFKDLSRMTVFSNSHYEQANITFPSVQKHVLYSGVDMLEHTSLVKNSQTLTLMLTGSIYNQDTLSSLLYAINKWTQSGIGKNVLFRYAGNDGNIVQACAKHVSYEVKIDGFLQVKNLQHLQSSVDVNLYIYNPRCLLHYKTLELISRGRPVIAFPGETTETRLLAENAGCKLIPCNRPEDVVKALDMIIDAPAPPNQVSRLENFSWESRAKILETVLKQAISKQLQSS